MNKIVEEFSQFMEKRLQENVGNKLTAELATGMYHTHIEQLQHILKIYESEVGSIGSDQIKNNS